MPKEIRKLKHWLQKGLGLALRAYRCGISPLLPQTCRFYPSCSQYAEQSIRNYGVFRGMQMAVKRLCRCHPLAEGGYDPVPILKESKVVHGS